MSGKRSKSTGKPPNRPRASRVRAMPVRYGEDLQIANGNALEQYLAGSYPKADVRKAPKFDWKFRWKNTRFGDPVRFGDWVQLETGSGWLLNLADLNDMEPGHSGGDLVKMVHQTQSRSHNTHWRLYSPTKRRGAVMRHGDLFYLRSLLREEHYLSIEPWAGNTSRPRALAGVRTDVKKPDHKAGLWRAEPIKTDLTEATDKAISYAKKNKNTEVLKDVLLVEFSSFMGAQEANAEKAAGMIQEAVRGTAAKPITRPEDYDRRKILNAFREMMRPDPGLAVNKSYYAENLAAAGATPAERQAFLDAIDASFKNQLTDAQLDELIHHRRSDPSPEREQIAVPPAEQMPLWLDVAIGILAFSTPFTGILLNVSRGLSAATGFTFAMGAEAGGGAGAAGAFQGGICTYPDGRLGFYGSAEAALGMIASISLTYQLTVVFGGIDMFKGEAIVAGMSAGPEPVIPLGGNVGMIFALPGGEPIGMTCGVGIGTGLPVEVFVQYSKTDTLKI